MREIDHMAEEASADIQKMNLFIEKNEKFILKCAAKYSNRYITKCDEEWSLALIAFKDAIVAYSFEKGSFYSFAELVIHRRLIDYFRSQSKYNIELPVDPAVFNTDSNNVDANVSVRLAIADQLSKDESVSPVKLEIEAANEVFSGYGFSFYDLTRCSPRAEKTKKSCAAAAAYLLNNAILMNELRRSKKLPINVIEKNLKIPRKLLERHRKYIIAAVEILYGDYPCLAEYMRFIRKELGR